MKKIPQRPKKPRVPYCPRFHGSSFEGRTYNMIKQFFPRLAKEHEFDDLLQEAVLVFLICRERFADSRSGKVDNPAWFMSLFARALYWRFIDLQRGQFSYISLDELAEEDEPVTERDAGFCWRVLQELPGDMKELLRVLGLGDDSVLPALKTRFRDLASGQPLMTKEMI